MNAQEPGHFAFITIKDGSSRRKDGPSHDVCIILIPSMMLMFNLL